MSQKIDKDTSARN